MVQPFAKVDASLTTHLVILVPSTNKATKVSDAMFQSRINDTQKFLANVYGGTTKVNAEGVFFSKDGERIEEKIAKVEMFTTPTDWSKNRAQLIAWLRKKKKEWQQLELAIEYEENMYWV